MKKHIILALIVAIFSASLTGCVMFFAGNQMQKKEQEGEGMSISSLFSSKEKETEVHFVSIKNIVITPELRYRQRREHRRVRTLFVT
ncbi:hypothetical protein [Budvicia aquatica]|uniref:Lipoprotein n=1 Tax=Budvicia aquatica TaxID=82979 RepID=A0A484ZHE6_9GAMM|nr:hypothetical protein [Budvicia aquatica]VFS47920.1 Uncharacterised protein [Budvicia aquatica]